MYISNTSNTFGLESLHELIMQILVIFVPVICTIICRITEYNLSAKNINGMCNYDIYLFVREKYFVH